MVDHLKNAFNEIEWYRKNKIDGVDCPDLLIESVYSIIGHLREMTPQEACQNQSLKDRGYNLEAQVSNLQSHLDWRNDELKKARDYSGCPPDGDLVEHFGRLVTERDEFRRLYEEGQEALKECAKLRRSLHAVINEAKEALGVSKGESLVEECRELNRAFNQVYEMVKRAMEHLGAGEFENVDHAAERVVKERKRLHDALIDEIGKHNETQNALDEQMAENGRLAGELRKKNAQYQQIARSQSEYRRLYKEATSVDYDELDAARDAYEFAVEELRAEVEFSEQMEEQVASARRKNVKLVGEARRLKESLRLAYKQGERWMNECIERRKLI